MSAVPLPEPYDYCYEWNSPLGFTRKLDYRERNGMKPDRSVPLYTAYQLREYEARVREQIAGEILAMELPEDRYYDCGIFTYDERDVIEFLRRLASSIALGTTTTKDSAT